MQTFMAWRLRLMRDGPGGTFRRIGRAVTKAAQALTTDLTRSISEEAGNQAGLDDDLDNSGDGDYLEGRDRHGTNYEAEDDGTEDGVTDTSTVGTTAKIRLRKKHKRRFLQSRENVYAHQ